MQRSSSKSPKKGSPRIAASVQAAHDFEYLIAKLENLIGTAQSSSTSAIALAATTQNLEIPSSTSPGITRTISEVPNTVEDLAKMIVFQCKPIIMVGVVHISVADRALDALTAAVETIPKDYPSGKAVDFFNVLQEDLRNASYVLGMHHMKYEELKIVAFHYGKKCLHICLLGCTIYILVYYALNIV